MERNLLRKLWADFKEIIEGSPGYLILRLGAFEPNFGDVVRTPEFRSPIIGDVIMGFALPIDKKVPLSIAPVDSKGNPAKIDGVPTWTTDNTDAIALVPEADGLTCRVVPTGTLSATPVLVQVSCDADLGPGMAPLIGVFEVNLNAGSATTINITPGPLEPNS